MVSLDGGLQSLGAFQLFIISQQVREERNILFTIFKWNYCKGATGVWSTSGRARAWLKVGQGEVTSFIGHVDLSVSGQVDAPGRQTDGWTGDHDDTDVLSHA